LQISPGNDTHNSVDSVPPSNSSGFTQGLPIAIKW